MSLNTVRTHTKNIYAKLGVTNRRAAVRRGEELDLLSRIATTDRPGRLRRVDRAVGPLSRGPGLVTASRSIQITTGSPHVVIRAHHLRS